MPEFVARAKELGMPGVGITDHGNLSGIIEFYRECKNHEINPNLGIEAYFCDDRHVKAKPQTEYGALDGTDKRYYHLTLLAENNTGYHNLIKASSDSYLTGHYFKPRMDWDSISEYSEGLIAASGCLGGPVLQPLLHERYDVALEAAARLQDIFGKENFFIEMMDHGLPEQKKTNPQLLSIAKKLDAPLLVTLDCHYTHSHDATAHSSLLCLQTGAKLSDPKRFKFNGSGYYLQDPADVRHQFRDNISACDNTLAINERCNVTIDFDSMHLPDFPVPNGYATDFQYLESLAFKGLLAKSNIPSQEYYDRLTYELGVIKSMGVSSYFLILWDVINLCKKEGILYGPGRGSAAGCLVAYCLDITKVDPVEYGLIFERFLNPGRIALPDIDMDFPKADRDRLIHYVSEKYGEDHVAQIMTFTTIKARSAVRDAARVLGHEPKSGDKLAKMMPPLVSGFDTPLYACLREDPQYEQGFRNAQSLRDEYETDPIAKEVIDVAVGLEGLIRTTGIHAAGVVVGDTPLVEQIPLATSRDGQIVTQWDKDAIEDAGFLKMDFLGLKTLDVLAGAIELIPSMELDDLDGVPINDAKTFDLLRIADTVGVFQLSERGMRSLLQRVAPDNIGEISAVLALYRPGPMSVNMHNDFADRKHGYQAATPFHPDAQDILKDTYQLAIFQEQILLIARKFAGYDMTEADTLRKILGKKLKEKMVAERVKFVAGCVAEGYGDKFGDRLFEMIEGFSQYSFNLSHAMSYGFIAYWTAYLKANFRREFMASLCSSVMDDHEQTAVYLADCRDAGMTVHPPDINESNRNYTVTPDGIRVGLGLVRNLGGGLADTICSERAANGPYVDVFDLCLRVPLNSSIVAYMASGGALDGFGVSRQGVVAACKEIVKSVKKTKKKLEAGQGSLFDGTDVTVEATGVDISPIEFEHADLLKAEKAALGIYFAGHPIEDYTPTPLTLTDIKYTDALKPLEILVLVVDIKPKTTKAGDSMAILTLEDRAAEIESVCFPRAWNKIKGTFKKGAILKAKLKTGTDFRDEKNYILEDVTVVDDGSESETDYTTKIGLYLPKGFSSSPSMISKLKGLLIANRGKYVVQCYLSRSTVLDLGADYLVEPSPEFLEDFKELIVEYRKGN